MPVVTDTNVIQLQSAIDQQWDGLKGATDAAITSGQLSPTSQLSNQEDAMNSRVLSYLAMTPSYFDAGAQMDQGEALQRDLNAYGASLAKAGVSNVPAPASVPAPMDLFGSLGNIGELILVVLLMAEFGHFGKR